MWLPSSKSKLDFKKATIEWDSLNQTLRAKGLSPLGQLRAMKAWILYTCSLWTVKQEGVEMLGRDKQGLSVVSFALHRCCRCTWRHWARGFIKRSTQRHKFKNRNGKLLLYSLLTRGYSSVMQSYIFFSQDYLNQYTKFQCCAMYGDLEGVLLIVSCW